jgi:hypothetical protein
VDGLHQALGDGLEHLALGGGDFAQASEALALEHADVGVRQHADVGVRQHAALEGTLTGRVAPWRCAQRLIQAPFDLGRWVDVRPVGGDRTVLGPARTPCTNTNEHYSSNTTMGISRLSSLLSY